MTWFVKRRRAQHPDDYETWQQEGVSPTLNAFDNTGDSRATVLVTAFTQNQREEVRDLGEQAGALSAAGGMHQSNYLLIFENSFRDGARIGASISHTLPAKMGTGGLNQPMIATTKTVRRLTPTECERLMGWPDNHTLHRADGKTNSDSTRYKMCGNGVASPVAEWIARQLLPLLA